MNRRQILRDALPRASWRSVLCALAARGLRRRRADHARIPSPRRRRRRGLHGPAAGERRRAGVQAQSLGQHQGRATAAAAATTPAARRRASRATTTSTSPTRPRTRSSTWRSPDQSRMVTKVGGGHNCWLVQRFGLRRHADGLDPQLGRRSRYGRHARIQLQAPDIKDVGASKTFPDDARRCSRSTIYPVCSTQYCSRCHSSTAAIPQSPFFAERRRRTRPTRRRTPRSTSTTPAQSRLVVRLRDEFHNCWTDCATERERHAGGDPELRDRHRRSRRSTRRS